MIKQRIQKPMETQQLQGELTDNMWNPRRLLLYNRVEDSQFYKSLENPEKLLQCLETYWNTWKYLRIFRNHLNFKNTFTSLQILLKYFGTFQES